MTFANPEFFLLLVAVPAMILWYWRRQRSQLAEMQFSTVQVFHSVPRTWRQRLRHGLFALRILAFILLVTALARPQSTNRGENVTTEGIDIVLAQDISGSMLDRKLNAIAASGADRLVSCDLGCLLHLEGGLRRRGEGPHRDRDAGVRQHAEGR